MSKPRLLLADDSVTIQKVVNLTFADEGIDVIAVGDGDAAMEKIAHETPDIVLADVHMPGVDGYQICERLRQNSETREIPVVLLVGSFEPFDEAEAERVGANSYLTKPFQSIRQLVSQVTELIEARSAAQSENNAGTADTIATETLEQRAAAAGVADSGPETVADITDIESLYERSLSDTEPTGIEARTESEHNDADAESSFDSSPTDGPAPDPYGDPGMDDEMIEERRGDEEMAEPAIENDAVEATSAVPEPAELERHTPSPFDTVATGAGTDGMSELESDEGESYFDQLAVTEQIPAHEGFQLDEIELLELPPLENGKTLEFTTTERMIALGENKQVVSLSPELIDVIVQKVVEKISEKY